MFQLTRIVDRCAVLPMWICRCLASKLLLDSVRLSWFLVLNHPWNIFLLLLSTIAFYSVQQMHIFSACLKMH